MTRSQHAGSTPFEEAPELVMSGETTKYQPMTGGWCDRFAKVVVGWEVALASGEGPPSGRITSRVYFSSNRITTHEYGLYGRGRMDKFFRNRAGGPVEVEARRIRSAAQVLYDTGGTGGGSDLAYFPHHWLAVTLRDVTIPEMGEAVRHMLGGDPDDVEDLPILCRSVQFATSDLGSTGTLHLRPTSPEVWRIVVSEAIARGALMSSLVAAERILENSSPVAVRLAIRDAGARSLGEVLDVIFRKCEPWEF
jgi:hypothetical protein